MSSTDHTRDDESDPFDLARFLAAQAGSYETACRELEAGRKSRHWIWFVFPQLRGLGMSAMAHRYGIASLVEAKAYLAHPVLGPRLRHVTSLVLAIEGRTMHDVLGSPDDMKLRSSMTLFAHASADNAAFRAVLEQHYGGEEDRATLRLLEAA